MPVKVFSTTYSMAALYASGMYRIKISIKMLARKGWKCYVTPMKVLTRNTDFTASVDSPVPTEKPNLLGMTLDELETFFVSLGEKKFRGAQVFQWLYKYGAESFDDMTDISKTLRERLGEVAVIHHAAAIKTQQSGEKEAYATKKILFELADGQKIESVFIPDDERRTVCISTQVGCAVGCEFCATGWMGFNRNLTVGEIVGQLIYVRKYIDPGISNVVFMGMGEPFLNYENVIAAAQIIANEKGVGMAAKHITISTSGIIPKIYEYADEGHPYNLAISLNATTDEVRRRVMPITKKYPLTELLQAAKHFNSTRRNPVTLEYVLMADVNDTNADALRLRKFASELGRCKVNVIPYNPIEGPALKRPSQESIDHFMKLVSSIQSPLTLRRSRGTDISAACGQLAVKN
ncbi:23S rRNA (adenine(2503)-C(2))-methyltransferase RlmN [bacterium]|nr:23S rRNA (adenine(2503)-C(2))-methyltransferase RlmN [bacterium]